MPSPVAGVGGLTVCVSAGVAPWRGLRAHLQVMGRRARVRGELCAHGRPGGLDFA
ncbi:MAG: hypothetical protein GX880_09710 [Methanomicrobiales archaeon]|nr:hypothetical protein [Methanomicrobiales archaeon]